MFQSGDPVRVFCEGAADDQPNCCRLQRERCLAPQLVRCVVWGKEPQCTNCLLLPADTGSQDPRRPADCATHPLHHRLAKVSIPEHSHILNACEAPVAVGYICIVAVYLRGGWWYRRQLEAHGRRLLAAWSQHLDPRYGYSSGTIEHLVVTKDDIGDSRPALDAMTTSTTVKGTMTYHAACASSLGS